MTSGEESEEQLSTTSAAVGGVQRGGAREDGREVGNLQDAPEGRDAAWLEGGGERGSGWKMELTVKEAEWNPTSAPAREGQIQREGTGQEGKTLCWAWLLGGPGAAGWDCLTPRKGPAQAGSKRSGVSVGPAEPPRLQLMGSGSRWTGKRAPLPPGPLHSPSLGRDPLSPQTLHSFLVRLTHVLAVVLAGLLRGQLADQQGLHELPHEIKVAVEGAEGILGSREAGGKWGPPTSACISAQGGQGSPAQAPCVSLGNRTGPPTNEPARDALASLIRSRCLSAQLRQRCRASAMRRGCGACQECVSKTCGLPVGESEKCTPPGRCIARARGWVGPGEALSLRGSSTGWPGMYSANCTTHRPVPIAINENNKPGDDHGVGNVLRR